MSATLELFVAEAASGLTMAQWRQLGRLRRWIERNDPDARALLGPRAQPCVQAMRQARDAWRQRRRDPAAPPRTPPVAALRTLALASQQMSQCLRERPNGFFAPATSAIGQGLLLRLPALKSWLRGAFAQEAAVPPGSSPEQACARARAALIAQCLALCGAEDTYQRRGHLLQLLHDHGYREPLLRLVRRAGRGSVPAGWAESWEQIAGIADDKRAIDALQAAMAALTPALEIWAAPAKPALPAPPPEMATASAAAATPKRHAAPAVAAKPVIMRAAKLPRRTLWMVGAAAALAVGGGLALHLTRGNGAAAVLWVPYHEADGATMSIDPESIRKDGSQLTYRVSVVRRREGRSAVATFTTDCATRQRRLETVQHYSGTHYETATRYEVRGSSAGEWPATGIDVALLRAACERR